jgi:hypothetical protein
MDEIVLKQYKIPYKQIISGYVVILAHSKSGAIRCCEEVEEYMVDNCVVESKIEYFENEIEELAGDTDA